MERGFTLIELLVVIAIIGILATVVFASLNTARDRNSENANYKVCEAGGKCWRVESYTKENQGQCVFLSERELRICGDYTVQKLNLEEE